MSFKLILEDKKGNKEELKPIIRENKEVKFVIKEENLIIPGYYEKHVKVMKKTL